MSVHDHLASAATGHGATTPEHPHSTLSRRWYLWRHGALAPPAPTPDARRAQLLELLAVAECALAVVPESARLIAAVGSAAMVPVQVGRRCGEQLRRVHRLRVRLDRLAPAPEYATAATRLRRLLTHHQFLVHEAIGMAFTARPADRSDAYRARLGDPADLTDPAAELRAIRDELRSWCADLRPPRRPGRAGPA